MPKVHYLVKTKSRHEISTLGARGFIFMKTGVGAFMRFISVLIFRERVLWSQDN